MPKTHYFLLLAGICAICGLSSCNRASYVFQPKTASYPGDAAEAVRTRATATVAAAPDVSRPAVFAPASAAATVAVASAKAVAMAQPDKSHDKSHKKAFPLLPQRLATRLLVTRAVKILQPQRRDIARNSQSATSTKTTLHWAAGVLMILGLVIFLATVAANPTIEAGVLLIYIALASFIAGAILLIVSLFYKH